MEHEQGRASGGVHWVLDQDLRKLPLTGEHIGEARGRLETEPGAHLRMAQVGVDEDRPLAGASSRHG